MKKGRKVWMWLIAIAVVVLAVYFSGIFSVLTIDNLPSKYQFDGNDYGVFFIVTSPAERYDTVTYGYYLEKMPVTLDDLGFPITYDWHNSYQYPPYAYPGQSEGSLVNGETIDRQYSISSVDITIGDETKTIWERAGQWAFDKYQLENDKATLLHFTNDGIYLDNKMSIVSPYILLDSDISKYPNRATFMDGQLTATVRYQLADGTSSWLDYDKEVGVAIDVNPKVSIKGIDFTDAFDDQKTDKKLYVTIENNFTDFDADIVITNNIKQLSGLYRHVRNSDTIRVLKGTQKYAFDIDTIDVGAETVDIELDMLYTIPYVQVGTYTSSGVNLDSSDYVCTYKIPNERITNGGYCFMSVPVQKKIADYESQSLIGQLTADLDAKIALVQALQGNIDAQADLINSLSSTLEEKTLIVAGLQQSITDQAALIEQLSANTDEQAAYIRELDATIQQKAQIIDDLQLTVQEQSDIIAVLTQKRDEQAEYIAALTTNIQEQAALIEQLSANLQDKAELISQLTVENERQAELIAEMEDSFVNQGIIIDQLNKKVGDDAQIIGLLTTKADEQAQIISAMNLNIQEQAQIILDLQSKNEQQAVLIGRLTNVTEQQGMIIADMNLSLQDSAVIISQLSDKVQDQVTLIKELKLTNDQEQLLVTQLTDKIAEQQQIIEELQRQKRSDNNIYIYVTVGIVILIIIVLIAKRRRK